MSNKNVEFALRFSIGPWKGRYSSVWSVWSNPGSDDVYLGVKVLLKYLKISLHKSGKFRFAFTESYNQQMVGEGKRADVDRAFMKWDKKPVVRNQIMQALDIHFPLSALSLKRKPQPTKGKSSFFYSPTKHHLEVMIPLPLRFCFIEYIQRANLFIWH